MLKPVKVEMLNLNPDLHLFRDVITDSEIELVKKLAKHQVVVYLFTLLLVNNNSFIEANKITSNMLIVYLFKLIFNK